jgi:predicted nucleic acid-binding protein
LALALALANQVGALFEDRVLNFDARAAHYFAACLAGAQAQGNPVGFADCAIAAIAKTNERLLHKRRPTTMTMPVSHDSGVLPNARLGR